MRRKLKKLFICFNYLQEVRRLRLKREIERDKKRETVPRVELE